MTTRDIMTAYHSRVSKTATCWLWTGGKAAGYGKFHLHKVDGKPVSVRAHRFAWELHHQMPVPDGMHVLHSCDIPLCVNPDHLRIGTNADNVDDRVTRHRTSRTHQPQGQRHPRTMLTDEQVTDARRRYRAGEGSTNTWAATLGISQAAAWNLLNGKTWRHLP